MIPPHARKVYDGEIFEIYQWEQELFDGSVETFERARRKTDTVQVIAVTDRGMIVLVDEEQPHARRTDGLPGGRIDPGEDPLTAAARELREETGYTSEHWTEWRTYLGFPKVDWNVHYLIARGCEKRSAQHLDPGEHVEVKLLSFDDFIERATRREAAAGDFTSDLLRMRLDPEALAAFKRSLGL